MLSNQTQIEMGIHENAPTSTINNVDFDISEANDGMTSTCSKTILLDEVARPSATQGDTSEAIKVKSHQLKEEEQSWMLRFVSDSSVACVTGDFAMQNVLLHMGIEFDVMLLTALLEFYGMVGNLGCMRKVFDEMPKRSSVSWSARYGRYVKCEGFVVANDLFDELVNLPWWIPWSVYWNEKVIEMTCIWLEEQSVQKLRLSKALVSRFRAGLQAEIGVFLPMIVLRVLENVAQPIFQQKMIVFRFLEKLCINSQMLVDIFLNYDCDVNSSNIIERMVNGLLKTAQGVPPGAATSLLPPQEATMKLEAMRCLVAILNSMGNWMNKQLRIPDLHSTKKLEMTDNSYESREMPMENGKGEEPVETSESHFEASSEVSDASTIKQRRAYKLELQEVLFPGEFLKETKPFMEDDTINAEEGERLREENEKEEKVFEQVGEILGTTDTYLILICNLFTDKNGKNDLPTKLRATIVQKQRNNEMDAFFILWIFPSLSKTLEQLQAKRSSAKSDIYEVSLMEQELKDIIVGDACLQWRHQLDIPCPVNNGIVQNWDDIGHVWDHAFYSEMKINPTECKILLTDPPPLNPSKNRKKMVESMFEKYNFAGVFIQIQAVLTLYVQLSNMRPEAGVKCNFAGLILLVGPCGRGCNLQGTQGAQTTNAHYHLQGTQGRNNKCPLSFVDVTQGALIVTSTLRDGYYIHGQCAMIMFDVTDQPMWVAKNMLCADMEAMELIIKATGSMDDIFQLQLWNNNPSLRDWLTWLLHNKADAFLPTNYYDSDIAWKELDSKLDVTIDPYETYEDALFSYKATFEAFVGFRDDITTTQVKLFEDNLHVFNLNLENKVISKGGSNVMNSIVVGCSTNNNGPTQTTEPNTVVDHLSPVVRKSTHVSC